ncbi:hypothetical protein LJC38_03245 [Parabacteroides sp. OttesenSCG-928-K15]|nr:hypothetical protein [Parabacteroides sp. OttesenSCG-928-K15]
MKKIRVMGVAMMAAIVMLFSSCLGDTSTIREYRFVPAVVTYIGGYSKIGAETIMGTLYVPELDNLAYMEGDCIWLSFQYDSEDPNNVNEQANGYSYVKLLTNPTAIDKGFFIDDAPDLEEKMNGEIPLLYGSYNMGNYQYFSILNNYLFMTSVFKGKEGQGNRWQLYYDRNAGPRNVDGTNVYTFYVRAVMTKEGTANETNYESMNAFPVNSVISQINDSEFNQGNSSFGMEFKFVEKFDEEGKPVWSESPEVVTYSTYNSQQ